MKILRELLLATLLTGAMPAVVAGQYETIDYHVQQMIAQALAQDDTGVQTFREQLENLTRPETGDATQARPSQQQGQDQLARNRPKEALAAFRQAFIANPADPDIAAQLGLTYLRLGRLKEAERLSVYGLSLAPNRSAIWLTLGQVYGQSGDAQRASGAFANAYRFAQDRPQLSERLRQLSGPDSATGVRTGAEQALRLLQSAPAAHPATGPAPAPPQPVAPVATPPRTSAAELRPATPANAALLDSLKRGLVALGKPPTSPATASGPSAENGENPGQRIYRRSIPLTCLIVTLRNGKADNLGSGLLVSPDGLILTNDHVIERADNLTVRCGDREAVASVRRRSKTPDLALLATALKSPDSFVLNDTYNQDLIGLDVFVIGNPYGLEGTFSTGVISGLRQIEGVRYIQISAPISPGNSGGPVILRDGSVIGIATMRLKDGQNLNFAIAAADIVASGVFDPARMHSRSLPGAGKQ